MKKVGLIFSLLVITLCTAQEDVIGEITLEDFKATEHGSWFERYYNAYQPDQKLVEELTTILANKEFKIEAYFGTWCPDSRRELPRLVKLLDEAQWDTNQLQMVGVDRNKKIPSLNKEEKKRIALKMIPTFIFSLNNKEVNRFVEYAVETIEKDVLIITQEKEYKNPYSK